MTLRSIHHSDGTAVPISIQLFNPSNPSMPQPSYQTHEKVTMACDKKLDSIGLVSGGVYEVSISWGSGLVCTKMCLGEVWTWVHYKPFYNFP